MDKKMYTTKLINLSRDLIGDIRFFTEEQHKYLSKIALKKHKNKIKKLKLENEYLKKIVTGMYFIEKMSIKNDKRGVARKDLDFIKKYKNLIRVK